MSNRSFAILAAAVVVLGAFIWFFERHEPTTDEASKLAKKVFSEVESDEIRGLEVDNRFGTFAFSKTDGTWRLTSPISGPADTSSVDRVVTSVLGLDVERTLNAADIEDDAYGLSDPELAITLIMEDGTRHHLAIGGETPLGGKRAIARGDREVLLTSGTFTTGLDKELDDWRSRDLVTARLADLSSIEIETPHDRIDAIQVDGEWRLRSPVADLADSELLQTFVGDINGVRVEDFIDSPEGLENMGLTPPRHHIMLVRTDGTENTVLDFGSTREVDGATQILCRRNGVDFFWVSDRAETVLGKAPVRWREPRVRPFDTWDVDGLLISTADDAVTLNRENAVWSFDNAEAANADSVQQRLSALAELEVVDFDLMDLGTDEIARVTVGRRGPSSADLTFVFHRPLGEGGNILVEVTGRDTLMSVRPDDAAPIFEKLDELHSVIGDQANAADETEVATDS